MDGAGLDAGAVCESVAAAEPRAPQDTPLAADSRKQHRSAAAHALARGTRFCLVCFSCFYCYLYFLPSSSYCFFCFLLLFLLSFFFFSFLLLRALVFLLCCLRGMTCSLCPRGRRRRSRAGAHRRCGVRLRRLRRRSCSARAQACCRCGAICASANPLTPRSGCGRFVTDTHARYIRMFNTNECVVVFSRLMRRSCSAPAQACCRSGAICLCICQPVDASFQLRQVHSCMFLIHNTASRTGKDMNLDVTEFPSPTRCLNLSFRL